MQRGAPISDRWYYKVLQPVANPSRPRADRRAAPRGRLLPPGRLGRQQHPPPPHPPIEGSSIPSYIEGIRKRTSQMPSPRRTAVWNLAPAFTPTRAHARLRGHTKRCRCRALCPNTSSEARSVADCARRLRGFGNSRRVWDGAGKVPLDARRLARARLSSVLCLSFSGRLDWQSGRSSWRVDVARVARSSCTSSSPWVAQSVEVQNATHRIVRSHTNASKREARCSLRRR